MPSADAARAGARATEPDPVRRAVQDVVEGHLRQEKQLAESLGQPPWGSARFQAFGMANLGPSLAVPGSDYAISASPEASLDWYLRKWGLDVPEEAIRLQALRVLEEYELQRKRLLVPIIDWLTSNRSLPGAVDAGCAFLIIEGRLFLLSAHDSADVREGIAAFSAELEAAREALREEASR